MATEIPSFVRVDGPSTLRALGVLVVGLLIGAAVGLAWSATRAPSYASTAVLMVAIPSTPGGDELDALRGRPAIAPSFATIAVTPDAVARVTDALGIPDEAASVLADANARVEQGSTEVSITARHADPATAAAIANGLARDLLERTTGVGTGSLVALGPALPPTSAENPMVPLAVAIGAVVGLAIAAAALLSRPRRSVSQAIPPGVFARGTAASVDRPVDPTPQLVLGAVLGGAILVAVAFQLPSVLALFVSFLVIGVAAVLPAAGLAALIVLLPHQEPAVLGALGVKLPLLAALGYGLFVRSLAARQLPRLGLGIVAAVGLVGIAAVSAIPTINGLDAERAIVSASRFLPLLAGVAMILVSAWYFLRRDPTPFIVLMLLSVTFACLLAVLQLVAGDQPIPLITGLYAGGQAQGLARVTGTFENPNYFGLFAGLGVVLALGIAVEAPQHRRIALLCLPVIGLAVLGTLSRGSVAATGIGVLAWLWFRNRQLAVLSGAAFLVLGLVVAPLLVDARLGEATAAATAAAQQGLSESDQQRFESVAAGSSLFLLDPLFGVGFGQYEFVSPRFVGNSFATSAHNQYLKILAEQGIVGAGVYIAAVAALLLAMLRSGSRWRQTSIAMLAVYAVSGLFLEPLTTFQASGALCLMLGVVLAGPAAERVAISRRLAEFAAGARAAAAPSRTATS